MPIIVLAMLASAPTPVAYELQAPSGPEWRKRAAQTLEVADGSLTARSTLSLRSLSDLGVPPAKINECRGRATLDCWVRATLAVDSSPFATPSARVGADFLLVRLLPLPRPGRVLVLMWLVDLELAARAAGRPEGRTEGWLLRNATVRRRIEVNWNDGALERAFERLWDDRKLIFRRRGVWRPNGSLRVLADWVPPFRVVLDDKPPRAATSTVVRFERVPVGVHEVRVFDAEAQATRRVTVQQGQQAVLHVERDSATRADERSMLLWSGVGVASAGAVITIAGLVVPLRADVLRICAPGDADCDSSGGFARSSDYFAADPSGGTGPLVVPLGYSLMVTGAAWALAALLSEDDDLPWWTVVLGVAAGGLAYGISEAAQ